MRCVIWSSVKVVRVGNVIFDDGFNGFLGGFVCKIVWRRYCGYVEGMVVDFDGFIEWLSWWLIEVKRIFRSGSDSVWKRRGRIDFLEDLYYKFFSIS